MLRRYVIAGRPSCDEPQLFLRSRCPIRAMKHYAVGNIFAKRAQQSGLPLQGTSPYTLRHSFAMRLLRRGVGVKPSAISSGIAAWRAHAFILRLDIDMLRTVALPVQPLPLLRRRDHDHDPFSTALDQPIAAWLAHQRALGRSYYNEERACLAPAVVAGLPVPGLDQASFDLWCGTLRDLDANTRRARQRIVRKFCLYRQRTEPGASFLTRLLCPHHPHRTPVIIGPEQVARCSRRLRLCALPPAHRFCQRSCVWPLSSLHGRAARGELLRLTLDDVEPRSGILRIRCSKFHKSGWCLVAGGRQ